MKIGWWYHDTNWDVSIFNLQILLGYSGKSIGKGRVSKNRYNFRRKELLKDSRNVEPVIYARVHCLKAPDVVYYSRQSDKEIGEQQDDSLVLRTENSSNRTGTRRAPGNRPGKGKRGKRNAKEWEILGWLNKRCDWRISQDNTKKGPLKMKEKLNPIPWFEWYYLASSEWYIKSVITGKILKPSRNQRWYCRVILYKPWIEKTTFVHRAICSAFYWESKDTVNHKNGIVSDNRICNLEWNTLSDNLKHSYKYLWRKSPFQINHPDKWKFGWNNRKSKPVFQYELSWNLVKMWWSIAEAERGLRVYNISKCCKWIAKSSWWFVWKYNPTT